MLEGDEESINLLKLAFYQGANCIAKTVKTSQEALAETIRAIQLLFQHVEHFEKHVVQQLHEIDSLYKCDGEVLH